MSGYRPILVAAGLAVDHEAILPRAVARAIVEMAEERRVDLIVVGSHSRVGLDWLFRSTADSVLRQAPCDVLAVHD
jgi:universal stress protein A